MWNPEDVHQHLPGDGHKQAAWLFWFRLATALTWSFVLMVMCWLPRAVVREAQGGGTFLQLPHFDKLVHGMSFAIFALLWMRVFVGRCRAIWVFGVGSLLAALTELVQELPMVGRDASFGDGFADLVGLMIGVGLSRWLEPVVLYLEGSIAKWLASPTQNREPLEREV